MSAWLDECANVSRAELRTRAPAHLALARDPARDDLEADSDGIDIARSADPDRIDRPVSTVA